MRRSSLYVGLFNEKSWKKDPTPVFQLGLAMMLDKPIVIVAFDDESIPENIRKVAVAVEIVAKDATQEQVADAVKRLMEKVKGSEIEKDELEILHHDLGDVN